MSDLFALNQWTDCLSDNNGKRPRLNPGTGKGISLARAKELASTSQESPHYGFMFTEDDPYVGIDVDVHPGQEDSDTSTQTIPQELLLFLATHRTHAHYSPSGTGLHIIYQLTPDACKRMNELKKKQGAVSINKGALFSGDWRWAKSFLTFTENLHDLSSDIGTLNFDQLSELLNLDSPNVALTETLALPQEPSNVIHMPTGLKMHTAIPEFKELQATLDELPATFNHVAQRACARLQHSQPQSNYEYWLLIGQACAHTALKMHNLGIETIDTLDALSAVEALFVKWSSRDPEFVSTDDVCNKFRSLLRSTHNKIVAKEQTATYSTLTLLVRGVSVSFPVLRGKTLEPDPNALLNYTYLLEHDGLALWFDTMASGYSIKGPEEIIAKWFCLTADDPRPREAGTSYPLDTATVATALWPYFQNRFKMSISLQQANAAAKHFMAGAKRTNAFKDWVDSKPWDGVPRFERVCCSIQTTDTDEENIELYQQYIRSSLYSMIGVHYWPEDNPKILAMLVLKGRQHTYKTSWAEWLLPNSLRDYLGSVGTDVMLSGGTERDRLLCTRALLVVNECEPMFTPRNEQRLKSCVDQEVVTYRDLYASSPVSRPRTALIIGTTNKPDLFTGSLGTRKIWQIPVKRCDTDLIRALDKQQLYAEIKALLVKFKKDNPHKLIQDIWGVSETAMAKIDETNRQSKGSMGLPELMIEVFGDPIDAAFDPEDYRGKRGVAFRRGNPYSLENKPNAWTLTNLLRFMKDRFPDDMISRKELKYAVVEYCELFTGSQGQSVSPFKDFSNAAPLVIRGAAKISKNQSLYLLPAIDDEVPESSDIELQ